MLLRFGDCALDPEALDLRPGGEAAALSPRAFRWLVLLLQSRPRALSHQRLRDALWRDTLAGYTSLAKLVAEVRRAIGDRLGGPPLVRTVARFGYAFVGPGPRSRGCAPRAAADGASPLSDRVVSHYRLLEPIGRVGSVPRGGEGERRRAHRVRAGGAVSPRASAVWTCGPNSDHPGSSSVRGTQDLFLVGRAAVGRTRVEARR